MLLSLYSAQWDYWQLYHKVTFDGVNKLIIINPDETNISVKRDLYSSWKEWIRLEENAKFLSAIRVSGGDPVGGGEFTGDVYFMINNWRVYIDHSCLIDGVLYSDDYSTPYIQVMDTNIVTNKVSSLVSTVETDVVTVGGNVLSVAETAQAVWNANLSVYTSPGTAGNIVNEIELTSSEILNIAGIVLKYQANRTKIDKVAKTLTVYDDNGTTPIKVFDLKDSTGTPSITEITERTPQ